MLQHAPPRAAFYALFVASGFAGLIYESIWTHYLKLFLGHAAYAQSLVLVVFMGGLAAGSALLARWSTRLRNPLAAYAVIAFLQGQAFLAVFAFTVTGALLGFLWYNAHPAAVFMGDAGALPLGAALATVALMTGHWLLLPVIGVVFVAEALSDVVQIAYFKTTHGRRLFRKTPLHHHLELLGWSEPQVVMRLYLFGLAGAMVGIALALSV